MNDNLGFLNRIERYKIKELFKSRLFWLGLILKIAAIALFSSSFLAKSFAPFVNYFVTSDFSNPYAHFLNQGMPEAFPYPALMLYILAIPRVLFSWLFTEGTVGNIDIFFYRLPMFFFDFAILLVLARWLKKSTKKLLIYYWLSPILFYISYLHGQLDIIPTAFIFISLYFLFKEKNKTSFFVLGLALATKTHVALIIPFYMIYLISKRHNVGKVFLYLCLTLLTFFVVNLQYIDNHSFQSIVFLNNQQAKVFNLYFSFGDNHKIFFVVVAYALLLLKALSIKIYSRDILILLLGFSFAIMTLLIIPGQGWYFWIIPFFAYFFTKNKEADVRLLYTIEILYFSYFLVIPESDYLEIISFTFKSFSQYQPLYYILQSYNIDVVSIIFSLLQVVLVINCIYLYHFGIKNFISQKIASKTFFIGIGGDSGAGKTTFSDSISKIFSPKNLTTVQGDDMHRWERGDANWKEVTHLDPKANNLHQEFHQLLSLKNGKAVTRSYYNHATGKFTEPKTILPNRMMIFEGLHPFYIRKVRDLYDMKVYIAPDERLHRHWKITRDVKKRGYNPEQVLKQIESREDDSAKYIKTQNQHADIVVIFSPLDEGFQACGDIENPELTLTVQFPNNIDAEIFIEKIRSETNLNIIHKYEENDFQTITVSGEISTDEIIYLAYQVLPDFEDIGIGVPNWEENFNGFLQLFTCFYIFKQIGIEYEY